MSQTAGDLLRAVRHRQGLTQIELATRAKTSQTALSRWERGTRSPTVEQLERLLDAAGMQLRLGSSLKRTSEGTSRAQRLLYGDR